MEACKWNHNSIHDVCQQVPINHWIPAVHGLGYQPVRLWNDRRHTQESSKCKFKTIPECQAKCDELNRLMSGSSKPLVAELASSPAEATCR